MISHSERKHALVSPSGVERWCACPPSVRFSEYLNIPEEESIYAAEGTRAHEIAEDYLRFVYLNGPNKHDGLATVEDREAITYATNYSQYMSYILGGQQLFDMHIEREVDLSFLVPESFGSVDLDVYIPERKELHVIDYKYGAGIPVKAFENGRPNKQLMLYLIGVLHKRGMLGYELCGYINLYIHIFQPRVEDGVSSHKVTVEELRQHYEDFMTLGRMAYNGDGSFKVGKHCKFCPGKGSCKSAAIHGMPFKKYIMDYIDNEKLALNNLSEAEITSILESEGIIRSWLDAVKKHAAVRAQRGEKYPGFKLVEASTRRAWSKGEEDLRKIVESRGLSSGFIYERKLKSPAQLEKEMDKEAFSAIFCDLICRNTGLLVIAPETDRRRSVTGKDASKLFDGFSQ